MLDGLAGSDPLWYSLALSIDHSWFNHLHEAEQGRVTNTDNDPSCFNESIVNITKCHQKLLGSEARNLKFYAIDHEDALISNFRNSLAEKYSEEFRFMAQ